MLKVTKLQYLYNFIKKKLGMEFIFCMQSLFFPQVAIIVFDGSGKTCSKYPNKEVDVFAIY